MYLCIYDFVKMKIKIRIKKRGEDEIEIKLCYLRVVLVKEKNPEHN